ncbi:TPA: hypothetical protein ACJJHV_002143, partial [Neisseria meningitidis]
MPFNANLAAPRAKKADRPPPQLPMQAARPSLQCFLFLNERSKTMKKTLVAAAILSLALTACG